MTYHHYRPRAPLSDYVDCLWYTDLRVSYQRERIVPTATVELIINFGSGFRLYDPQQANAYTEHRRAWLVGLQTGYLLNEPLAETHMIGVRFKPGGQFPFFPLPASHLHNQVVSADALWGRFIDEIRERLYEVSTVPARFALLESILLARLRATTTVEALPMIRYAVEWLLLHEGEASIRDLSDAIGISQKHLAHRFRHVVGVSPKALARVFRFQHVLHTIDPSRPVNWAQIAQDAFYYDQSHFNKDFTTFTGFSPSEYLRLRAEAFGSTLSQGEDVHFIPVG